MGNIEYKLKLINPTPERMVHLATQMKWRLAEGEGEALYEIGVADNGDMTGLSLEELELSLKTIFTLIETIGAHGTVLRKRAYTSGGGCVAEVLVRRVPDDMQFLDLRVAMIGSVDAGKSTLLAVLTTGENDNGKGMTRLNMFRHRHEIESGHTSSIGSCVIGFDSTGSVVTSKTSIDLITQDQDICRQASKIITFIDLAGHPKYIKTTVFGLTSRPPDFAALVISAATGIVGTCESHFSLAVGLRVPTFIIVTKIDICNKAALLKSLEQITSMVKSPKYNKIPVIVSTIDDVYVTAPKFIDPSIVPIFLISNVTGKNMKLLKMFLNLLPPQVRHSDELAHRPADLMVEETFNITGVGPVVAGSVREGSIRVGDELMLGPDANGSFKPVTITSIRRNRIPYNAVKAGQAASFALAGINHSDIRMGHSLISSELAPCACMKIEVDIFVVEHSSKICVQYQGMVHIGSVRQMAVVVSIEPAEISSGQRAYARLRFLRHPEYIRVGSSMLLMGAHGKCIGSVVKVIALPSSL